MNSLGALSWKTVLQPNCEIFSTNICICIHLICLQLYDGDRRTDISVPVQEGWQTQMQWSDIQHHESAGRRAKEGIWMPFPHSRQGHL